MLILVIVVEFSHSNLVACQQIPQISVEIGLCHQIGAVRGSNTTRDADMFAHYLSISTLSMLFCQVVSNEDQSLTLTSEKSISVEGHEGLVLDGKMTNFNADEDIEISSVLVIILFSPEGR